ncbi:MAG: TonB family protein [Gammaproteobacteria bacterium]
MRPHERYSLVIAAGLSIAVHAGAVVYFAEHGLQPARAQSPPGGAIQLRVTLAQIPVRAVPEPEPEPVPAPRQAARLDPSRAKPQPVLQAVPASARVVQPVPPPAPVPAPAGMSRAVPVAAAVATAAADAEAIIQQPLPLVPDKAQETYLQRLLAHIDSHKFYPRSARRRGQEGEVRVSFTLLADGSIRALQVKGSSRILRAAAERAVQSAQPMPAPPAAMNLREPISFGMVFRLG